MHCCPPHVRCGGLRGRFLGHALPEPGCRGCWPPPETTCRWAAMAPTGCRREGPCQRRELTGPSSVIAVRLSGRRPGPCGQVGSESPVAGARHIRRAGDGAGLLFLANASSKAWAARRARARAIPAFIAAVGNVGLCPLCPILCRGGLVGHSGRRIPAAIVAGRRSAPRVVSPSFRPAAGPLWPGREGSPVAGARQIRRAGDGAGLLFRQVPLPKGGQRAVPGHTTIPAFIAAVGMRGLVFAVPDPLPRRSG